MIMKRGDASIVATVLLIVSAIAIALMVTTFSKQTGEQVSEKIITMGSSVECADVRLSIDVDKNDKRKFIFENRGTLGVDKFFLRIYADRIFIPFEKGSDFSGCGNARLLPQQECIITITGFDTDAMYKTEIIPIIKTEDGELGCEERITTWTK